MDNISFDVDQNLSKLLQKVTEVKMLKNDKA